MAFQHGKALGDGNPVIKSGPFGLAVGTHEFSTSIISQDEKNQGGNFIARNGARAQFLFVCFCSK